MNAAERDRGTDAPHSSRCAECAAPLASDQRYCVNCGARRGELPAAFAALIAATFEQGPGDGRPRPDREPDPDPEGDPEGAQSPRPPWLPPARATAFAILCMLGFGVIAGSLVKPSPESLAHTLLVAVPPASAPAAASRATARVSGEVAGGGGGGGGGAGGGTETITRIIKTIPPPAQQQPEPAQLVAPPVPAAGGGKVGGGGGGGGGSATPPGGSGGLLGLPAVKHVFLIVLSDQRYINTFAPGAPDKYLSKALPARGELLQNYYAVAQSPLANGIALLSGQGPTGDTTANCPTYVRITPGTVTDGQIRGTGCVYPPAGLTLADQLAAKHDTWRAYIQGIADGPAGQAKSCRAPALGAADANQVPRPGDPYVTWRNPFVYFASLLVGSACHKDDVDLTQLRSDLKTASKTPSLSYIVPSPCEDGSDVPCATGADAGLPQADAFLRRVLPEIEQSPGYKDGGMIAITFDQAPQAGTDADPSACCGNPKYPNLVGVPPITPPGATTTTPTVATPPAVPGVTTPTTPTTTPTTPTTPTTTTPSPTAGGPTTPTGGGGQVGLLLISKFVQPGSTDLVDYYNHYSLLASIEDLFGLKHLGYADVASLPRFDSATYNGSISP